MRLYRYISPRPGLQPRIAVAARDRASAVDLLDAWGEVTGSPADPDLSLPLVSMHLLIEQGPDLWSEVADVAERAAEIPDLSVDLDAPEVTLLCPLDQISSLRDFLAFEDHVALGAARRGVEVPQQWYRAPIYYKGNHRSIIGPGEECPWPDYTDYLDLELELALVIGRRGRDIARADAGGHVFGFTVFNDFSARDVQAQEMTAWLGPAKGKDFANAFGPCIVTADEIGTEPDLEMVCRVNGEEWGRARSSRARWSWAEIIEHVSHSEDVWPGDVYGSGTPGGCCGLDLGRKLAPGDVVELEVEGIGRLRNKIAERMGSGF